MEQNNTNEIPVATPAAPLTPPVASPVRATPAAAIVSLANIKDFTKIQLIVAQIKEVKNHSNADKLYVIQVDTGPGGLRQIVAGIRSSYTPEQLINRRVVLVSNLEPAQLRGEVSNGMLLAASDEQGSSLLMPDRDVALGSRIK